MSIHQPHSLSEFEAIYNALETGVCVTDSEGKFRHVNAAYCSVYGYTPEELIGKVFTVMLAPEHHEYAERLHAAFLDGLYEAPKVWQVVRKDGTPIEIFVTAGRVIQADGTRLKVTTVTPVADIKQAILADLRHSVSEAEIFHDGDTEQTDRE